MVVCIGSLRSRRSVLPCFLLQAEDGIRDLVRSRGLGDVYKRQVLQDAEVVDRMDVAGDGLRQRPDPRPLLGRGRELSLIHI